MFRFLGIGILFFTSLFSYQHELSICCMIKDEGQYLKEWIEYHKLIGCEHFYLYDDLSTDNTREVLEPYIQSNLVELFECGHREVVHLERQYESYLECLEKATGVTKWLAYIDADEFLCPVKEYSLANFLKSYEEFGGLVINWQQFGTSFVKKIPEDKLLIETLTLKARPNHIANRTVKSIVRPERVEKPAFKNPHYCHYKEGFFSVNEYKTPCKDGNFQSISIDLIRCNHYFTRDEDFFYNVKIPRKFSIAPKKKQAMLELLPVQQYNKVEDKIIFKYVEDLRRSMKLSKDHL
jgi:glycosyltransferase involved in cell wall biosynthesis